jgi:hypothetical protein
MEVRTTRAPKMLPNWELSMCEYSNPILGEIVTMSEACVIWGKSKNAIKNAVLTHRIEGRKSFTGGDWLLSVASVIEYYGKPSDEKDMLSWLKSK